MKWIGLSLVIVATFLFLSPGLAQAQCNSKVSWDGVQTKTKVCWDCTCSGCPCSVASKPTTSTSCSSSTPTKVIYTSAPKVTYYYSSTPSGVTYSYPSAPPKTVYTYSPPNQIIRPVTRTIYSSSSCPNGRCPAQE